MPLTLRQLTIFQTVARHLSYTRAAEELHLSQPAVSSQIKQLEDNFGLLLFEQLGKKVYLTHAGEELLRYTQDILRQVEEAEQLMEDIKGGGGRLTVSVATHANYFLPHLLAAFKPRWPNAQVHFDVKHHKALLKHLENNDVDMVIMEKPAEELELVAEAFLDNPLVMIAPVDHPLAQAQKIPLAKLEDQHFLLSEKGSETRIAMECCFHQHALSLPSGMEMNSDEAIKQGVQAGLGLGVVSRYSLNMELALGLLTILSVESFPIMRHWYVVHRQGKRLSTLSEAFRQFLLAEAASLLKNSVR